MPLLSGSLRAARVLLSLPLGLPAYPSLLWCLTNSSALRWSPTPPFESASIYFPVCCLRRVSVPLLSVSHEFIWFASDHKCSIATVSDKICASCSVVDVVSSSSPVLP
ncbi:hypothetical protein TRVL_02438 [Trypanosoma vivax]|nr:hypothetical protein TRVL_02438 [Trypanosoma vivax]